MTAGLSRRELLARAGAFTASGVALAHTASAGAAFVQAERPPLAPYGNGTLLVRFAPGRTS